LPTNRQDGATSNLSVSDLSSTERSNMLSDNHLGR
jgi:hypothetical protein